MPGNVPASRGAKVVDNFIGGVIIINTFEKKLSDDTISRNICYPRVKSEGGFGIFVKNIAKFIC